MLPHPAKARWASPRLLGVVPPPAVEARRGCEVTPGPRVVAASTCTVYSVSGCSPSITAETVVAFTVSTATSPTRMRKPSRSALRPVAGIAHEMLRERSEAESRSGGENSTQREIARQAPPTVP